MLRGFRGLLGGLCLVLPVLASAYTAAPVTASAATAATTATAAAVADGGDGGAASSSTAVMHRVLSCNIRVALTSDTLKGHGWDVRRDICAEVIRRQHADIVCLQEVLREQMNDLQVALPEFASFGFAGPEMDYKGKEYRGIAKNPIMFSRERYALVGGGTYWLSETPLMGGSTSWGSARPRQLNWVRLRDKQTGHEFRVMNLHLDHIAQEARMGQIAVALKESAQYSAEFPQIFTGDFNANVRNDVIKQVLSSGWTDTWAAVHGKQDAGNTVHGFLGPAYKPKKVRPYSKIDFIFVKGDVAPVDSHIIRDEIGGIYPSDHYFISADVKL